MQARIVALGSEGVGHWGLYCIARVGSFFANYFDEQAMHLELF